MGVGLAVGAGALVEEGRVDLWSDEVMGGAEVECVERERAICSASTKGPSNLLAIHENMV